jgi:dipeptidyl-peptidase-3
MGKLLVELQVRKSTADGAGAREYYTDLTSPMDPFTTPEVRNLVLVSTHLPRFSRSRSRLTTAVGQETCE